MQVGELERSHGDIASSCLGKISPHFATLRELDIRFYDNANNVVATILDKYSQVRITHPEGAHAANANVMGILARRSFAKHESRSFKRSANL